MFLSSQGHSLSIPTHLHAFQLHLTPINSTPTFARAGQWSADAFSDAYVAATKHYRTPEGWYHESNMDTGAPTHLQATSLQAFWPGLQVLNGDVRAAKKTHARLWSVWRKYEMFPERYQYVDGTLHASERYYPLRPELAESTAILFHATRDDSYRFIGEEIIRDINRHARVPGGFASVKDVQFKTLEDHMHSFFLAETCKYLYLLFDDSFLSTRNVIFNTEGHPLPVFARADADGDGDGDGSGARDGSTDRDRPVAGSITNARLSRHRDDDDDDDDDVLSLLRGPPPASPSPRRREYVRYWEDPSAALSAARHDGAGGGLTTRTCAAENEGEGEEEEKEDVDEDIDEEARDGGGARDGNEAGVSAASSRRRRGWKKTVDDVAFNEKTLRKLRSTSKRLQRELRDAMRAAKARAEEEEEEEEEEEYDEEARAKADADASVGGSPVGARDGPRCHVLDADRDAHTCRDDSDCGVDADTCAKRKCSEHRYCYTPA